jgi:hypothetical protein
VFQLTPHSYKQLFLTQAIYIQNIGNCWLHCEWMEILTLHSWKHYTHIQRTHHCIHYTQIYKLWLDDCLQRELALHFTLCLLTSTSTDANRTVMWCCILLSQTCVLVRLGENRRHHSVSYHEQISNMGFTCSYCAHYDIILTHHDTWLHECYQWHHPLFHYGHYLLMTIYSWCKQWMFISRATADSFMG